MCSADQAFVLYSTENLTLNRKKRRNGDNMVEEQNKIKRPDCIQSKISH